MVSSGSVGIRTPLRPVFLLAFPGCGGAPQGWSVNQFEFFDGLGTGAATLGLAASATDDLERFDFGGVCELPPV